MTCIADANVLFPLLVRGHVAHDVARGWWEAQSDGSVGLCLVARLAVLRLLTNRVAMNGAPITPNEALKAWQKLADDPRCFGITAEPNAHEALFVALVRGREPTPNLWSDAWLAALAQSLNYDIATFDRGFRSFKGIKLRLLAVKAD
jgi:toxin-antitoxin system PIN domain toxin